MCYQKTTSPPYPERVSDFIELSVSPLNGEEIDKVARVYDCLLGVDLITPEEHECLMNDISNLQIAMVRGTNPKGTFSCGVQATAGGCTRDNTFVIAEIANEETLPHEACHRASHLTIGERGHDPDGGFWIPDGGILSWDCICQRAGL